MAEDSNESNISPSEQHPTEAASTTTTEATAATAEEMAASTETAGEPPPSVAREMSQSDPEAVHVTTPAKQTQQRETWSRSLDFVLSSMGFAIGLGNVWRFPYLCYRNGGGAFLLPYVLMLFLAGLPLYFMEVALGQYSSSSLLKVWRAVPPMRGLGYGQLFIAFYVSIFYNVILAYCFYYFFASFTSRLPWIGCQNGWNTQFCSELFDMCIENDGIVTDDTNCTKLEALGQDELLHYNISINRGTGTFNLSLYTDPFIHQRALPSQEYWKHQVLQESGSINQSGTLVWQLLLCLLFAWIVIFLCLIKGVKSAGKVVYFTAIFPFIVLFILLIRAVTLPGHDQGIRYYIYPEWSRLGHAVIWRDAAVQIFFSLGAGGGGLLTLASYNKFRSNCYFNSLFVAIINCVTSFVSGFMIFAIVGHMAFKLGKTVKDFAQDDLSGFGLVFVACPEALTKLPGAPFWSLMFFFMLILLAVDSQFVGVEIIVSVIVDQFPERLRPLRTQVTGALCFFMFLLGLPFVSNAGGYWMSLFNHYAVSFVPIVAGILFSTIISLVYGYRRFLNDIRAMIGSVIVDHIHFYYWPIMWVLVTPLTLGVVLICHWATYEQPTYNGKPFPGWATAIGYLMMLSALLCFPAFWIFDFFFQKPGVPTAEFLTPRALLQRLILITRPRDSWGPLLPADRLHSWEVHEKNGTSMGGTLNAGSGNTTGPGLVPMETPAREEPDGHAPRSFLYAVFHNEGPVSDTIA
ncbi:sodium- and chloride-dependent glycine transporter 1-like [Diadema antillarum]|uniref:sodium- and chloride-dependent glycine transporter 1-like n=1 Tax=Diadema antillarum TaxID=105358 RepID=UPI003A8C3D60